MPRRLTVLIAAALAAGCGGDDQGEQLRPGELTLLSARVAAVRDAVVAGERGPALDAVADLRRTVRRLSPRLAADEERALRLASRRIAVRIRADLAAPAPPPAEETPPAPVEEADEDDEKGKGKAKGKKKKDKD